MNGNDGLDGLLVVLSSPSGGGKTTVIKRLLAEAPEKFSYSVSMTTRPQRNGEVNGRDYWFVSEEEFQRRISEGDLIEYQKVHDWYYGTPKSEIERFLLDGKVVLFDLDVYGALRLKELFRDRALLIFLQPPNVEALITRLKERSTESEAQIVRRLQRLPEELAMAPKFDAVVVNDRFENTVEKVKELIESKLKSHHPMEDHP